MSIQIFKNKIPNDIFFELLDKICINHNTVDFNQIDPEEINILDKCEDKDKDEDEDEESTQVPSCAQP